MMKRLEKVFLALCAVAAVQAISGLLRNFGLIDDNEDGKLSEAELAKSKLTPGNEKLTASE